MAVRFVSVIALTMLAVRSDNWLLYNQISYRCHNLIHIYIYTNCSFLHFKFIWRRKNHNTSYALIDECYLWMLLTITMKMPVLCITITMVTFFIQYSSIWLGNAWCHLAISTNSWIVQSPTRMLNSENVNDMCVIWNLERI